MAENQSDGDISQVWVVILTHHQTRAWPSSLLEGVCAETGDSGFAGSDTLCAQLPHDGPRREATNVCGTFGTGHRAPEPGWEDLSSSPLFSVKLYHEGPWEEPRGGLFQPEELLLL